jgi:hypothetical protein
VVRLGLIQWQMRSLTNLDALLTKPFIDAVSGYGSDFALFPEFYGTLMADSTIYLKQKRLEN